MASGGELSRLVLALRLAGGPGEVEALVFDEIDSGIGGTTAVEVGRKLAALANRHQVLCVTHLPQVAAFADVHYVVTRTEHSATVERLDGELHELLRIAAVEGEEFSAEVVAQVGGGDPRETLRLLSRELATRHRLVRWGTALHDRFMLPHYMEADLTEVTEDLCRAGFAYRMAWLDPFFEFRFPRYGTVNIDDIVFVVLNFGNTCF